MKIVINTVICTNVYGTFNDLKCSAYLNLALVLYNSFLEASEVSGSEWRGVIRDPHQGKYDYFKHP